MKEIFDRHAEGLSFAERNVLWRAMAPSRTNRSQSRWPRVLAGAAAALVLVVVLAVVRQPTVRQSEVPSIAIHREPTGAVAARTPDIATATRARPARPNRHDRPSAQAGAIGHELDAAVALAESLARTPATRVEPAPTPTVAPGVVTGTVTAAHAPVAYANVIVMSTRQGTMTDDNGVYRINGVPMATESLQVSVRSIGYPPQTRSVRVVAGEGIALDFDLGAQVVTKTLEGIEVRGEKRIDIRSSTTKQSITAEKLRELPVDNLQQAVATKAGVATRGGELHFRGGRGGEVKTQFNGVPVGSPLSGAPSATATPPVIPTTGGTKLPNDERYDSMFFRTYGVNPFVPTDEDSLSTFAVDVDAASYTISRRYLALGNLPPADAVRVEEFVNFFPQGYPTFEDDDFRILVDGAPSPFRRGYQLLRVGLKARDIAARNRKPARLTFVIDVSGSMDRENRLELVKRALRVLVDQLRDSDRVGIVVFGTNGRTLLEPTAIKDRAPLAGGAEGARITGRQMILAAIDQLQPEGSTNTYEGLRLGYEMARRQYQRDAINRIVLCADGVANEGYTGPQSILEHVRTEADDGIHLSTIGFGMGNYNDVLMEQLADKGDGNYYYVDDLKEARRVFVENLTGTLQTIAKDAKIQVEFDSRRVLRYRLLGFENRDVADRDFRNDKVDAGEIGAGHEVTALYEIKLAPGAPPGPIATVRLRYALPEPQGLRGPQVRELSSEFRLDQLCARFDDAAPQFRQDAAVAQLAEILRGSYWAKEVRIADVLSVARDAARSLHEEATQELVALIEKAAELIKARDAR